MGDEKKDCRGRVPRSLAMTGALWCAGKDSVSGSEAALFAVLNARETG